MLYLSHSPAGCAVASAIESGPSTGTCPPWARKICDTMRGLPLSGMSPARMRAMASATPASAMSRAWLPRWLCPATLVSTCSVIMMAAAAMVRTTRHRRAITSAMPSSPRTRPPWVLESAFMEWLGLADEDDEGAGCGAALDAGGDVRLVGIGGSRLHPVVEVVDRDRRGHVGDRAARGVDRGGAGQVSAVQVIDGDAAVVVGLVGAPA